MKLIRLCKIFFSLCLVLIATSCGWAGKKKTTVHTFLTEQWQESDYLGAGYHVQWDKIRPNIWMRVHRVDGEVADTVGLPNNVLAGQGAEWNISYNRNNLYSRIPVQDVASIDPTSGKCSSAGRCYGDWVNDELTWEESRNPGKYKDSSGDSFLLLKFPGQVDGEAHGPKKTRFRFDVFLEDNTPYWLRSASADYNDWENQDTLAEPHYPFKWVTFRVTTATQPAETNQPRADDIFFTVRNSEVDKSVFKINDERVNPIEKRVRWGKHIYGFTESFDFPREGEFFVEINVEDMEKNQRNLRVPILIEALGGLQLRNQNTDSKKIE